MPEQTDRLAHCVLKYLLWRAQAIRDPHNVTLAALRDYWWRQAKRANQ